MGILRGQDSERGMALVLVVLVLGILTSIVVDFVYGIYVNTSLLNNWQRLQEISLAAESGVSVAAEGLSQVLKQSEYYNVRVQAVPPMDPFDLDINVSIIIEEENSKLNINKIVDDFDKTTVQYDMLLRLLDALELDSSTALAIKDYIDTDGMSEGAGFEDSARNSRMESIDELMLVAGVDPGVYNTLSPYVTVYGNGRVNINTAQWPVLASIAEGVTEDLAQSAIETRAATPFANPGAIRAVPGFESIQINSSLITVKGDAFMVTSSASDANGLRRDISCVLSSGSNVLYWREL